jgi:hypothetical protein
MAHGMSNNPSALRRKVFLRRPQRRQVRPHGNGLRVAGCRAAAIQFRQGSFIPVRALFRTSWPSIVDVSVLAVELCFWRERVFGDLLLSKSIRTVCRASCAASNFLWMIERKSP